MWATVFADAWGFCLWTLHSDAHSRTRRCPAPTSRIPRRANKLGIGAVHVRGPKRLRAVHRGKWPTPFHSGHRRHLSCRKAATFAHGCSPNIQFSIERATSVMWSWLTPVNAVAYDELLPHAPLLTASVISKAEQPLLLGIVSPNRALPFTTLQSRVFAAQFVCRAHPFLQSISSLRSSTSCSFLYSSISLRLTLNPSCFFFPYSKRS